MTEYLASLWTKLYTRKCRGCGDQSPHSHHLTWLGKRRFTNRDGQ